MAADNVVAKNSLMVSKKWVYLILTVLCLILVLPPIIHGYIYPNGGDDSGLHLNVIQQISVNHPIPKLIDYSGEWMVGYPMMLLNKYLHIPLTTSYLWFTYLALVGAFLSIYFVTSKLFGMLAGLLTAVLSVFLVGVILQQFLAGLVFNLINMSIIFLWFMYFLVSMIAKKKWKWAVPVLIIGGLFATFHATGRYLTGIGHLNLTYFNHVSAKDWQNYALVAGIILAVSGLGIFLALKQWKSDRRVSLFVLLLSGASIVLTLVGCPLFTISPVPVRQVQDAMNLSVIVGGFIISLWLKKQEPTLAFEMVGAVMVLGVGMITPSWLVKDFSALKPADKQAIAYINTLNDKMFYGNEYVAPWIYSHYLNKEYKPDTGVYIWRSVPMTMQTDPTTDLYWNPHGDGPDMRTVMAAPAFYDGVRKFQADGVTIYVAEVAP